MTRGHIQVHRCSGMHLIAKGRHRAQRKIIWKLWWIYIIGTLLIGCIE